MKHKILTILFACAALMSTSCSDEELFTAGGNGDLTDYDIPEGIRSGYSLNMAVSLTSMSGGGSKIDTYLEEIENYISPDKFRVLFFDSEDKFLFESRSRWVKKLDARSANSRWLVSVPVFTYGNDIYKDDENNDLEYDWEAIREILRADSFKVAILVNRPELEWYPSFNDLPNKPAHWFDNRGPFWDPRDFRQRDIFDLHHCQYDPVYHGKSKADGMYDFIMGNWDAVANYGDKEPTMGATSSWVNWGRRDDNTNDGGNIHGWPNKDDVNVQLKSFIHPSQEYPIPMYGVQRFAPITKNWVKGMPFNLSDIAKKWKDGEEAEGNANPEEVGEDEYEYKNVSLLRSVVRLELRIPKEHPTTKAKIQKPDFVSMLYPNIYARCEPLDVWTPTDELWNAQHADNNANCEFSSLLNYGPVSRSTDAASSAKIDYQNRMSWFYGAWIEDGKWEFQGENGPAITNYLKTLDAHKPYPRIFNSCVQRNLQVICDEFGDLTDKIDDGYYNYVVYVGERNVNDPNDLMALGKSGSGSPTVQYWMFNIGNQVYGIPITDYSNPLNPVYTENILDPEPYPTNHGNYADYASGRSKVLPKVDNHSAANGAYEDAILKENIPDRLSWPLIRNHVYRLTVVPKAQKNEMTYTHTWNFLQTPYGETVKDLNVDANWSSPRGYEYKPLYFDTRESTGGNANTGFYRSWGTGRLTRYNKAYENGSNIVTDNGSYQSIKSSSGVQNTLTIPTGKAAKKMTIYSYINKDVSANTLTLTMTVNGNVTGSGQNRTFGNSYSSSNRTNYLEISTTGGFKAGDIITVRATRNSSTTSATLRVYPAGGGSMLFDIATDGQSHSYTLGEDYQGLWLGRNGSTGVTTSVIQVQRPVSVDIKDTYWSEVAGVQFDPKEKGVLLQCLNNPARPDIRVYDFENAPRKEITFTSVGEQVCFVAFIELENDNGLPDYWQYSGTPNGTMKANNKEIRELSGLKFSGGQMRIYDLRNADGSKSSKLRLTGQTTITFPKVLNGHVITVIGNAATDVTGTPSMTAVNTGTLVYQGTGNATFTGGTQEFKWVVNTTSQTPIDVQLRLNANGTVDFHEFRVEAPEGSRGAADADDGPAVKVSSDEFYPKHL